MSDVIGKKVNGYNEACRIDEESCDLMFIPGAFWFVGNPPTRMHFICPCGCGVAGGVGVGPIQAPKVWEWNGDLEKPTVRPSILFLSGCQWHGFLTDGVFRSC